LRVTIPSGDHMTVVEVSYPRNHRIGLRGSHAPLSWEHTQYPDHVRDDLHVFRIRVPRGEILELKVVRNDDDWAAGRNYAVHGGDHLHIAPVFERATSRIEPCVELTARDGAIPVEVLLPPSYDEHPNRTYPVLYALDGQALFSTSKDPYGVWNIEQSLDALYELSAIEELIVVGVHTAARRLERLSPVPDLKHGGGDGRAFLDDLINVVHGHIASRYRVADDRGILGSSMGGLFAFFAAWTRPDFFRRAACLSSSFWWANRWAPRFVAQSEPPPERPVIYLDSGAARDPTDPDPNVKDGFHHSRSMFRALTRVGYAPGTELHRMVFPGHAHEPAAWGSRVSTPLQLLYPTMHVTP
jgi:predicted alpha/beta superfamily hydrolase